MTHPDYLSDPTIIDALDDILDAANTLEDLWTNSDYPTIMFKLGLIEGNILKIYNQNIQLERSEPAD